MSKVDVPSLKEPRDRCTKGEEGRGVMFSFRSLKSIPLVGLMRPDCDKRQ